MLKIGEKAPDFLGVTAYQGGKFTAVNFPTGQNKWTVLFFYPRDFTFVCPTEIKEFAKLESEFIKANATVLGCSTDSEYSHKAWFERDLKEVAFPVLADTTHDISQQYGVLGADGASLRGTFVIDPLGILRWSCVSDNSVGRSVQEVLRALQALQTGELCPVEWHPGQATLGRAK